MTVTVNVVEPVQPTPEVPTIVYVVVVVGFAAIVEPVVADKPVAGLQENVLAPDAISVVLPPVQIALLPAIVTTGTPFTATVTDDVSVHPLAPVPVTVYVVVAVGVATGEAQVAQESVAAGAHT